MKKFLLIIRNFNTFIPWDFTHIGSTYFSSSFIRWRMKLSMLGVIFNKHKIFNSIIASNMIDMMNNFSSRKVATNMFFHYKTMFFNIISFISEWMIRRKNKIVSFMHDFTFKVSMICSFFKRTRVFFHNTFSSFVPGHRSFLKLTRPTKDSSFHRFCVAVFRAVELLVNKAFFNIKTIFTNRANFVNSCSHKYLLFLLSITLFSSVSTPVLASNLWLGGSGENTPLGTELINDIDTVMFQRVVDPLDRLLENYQTVNVVYDSASQFIVTAGEITCSDSGGTINRMRSNPSNTTVTWADIDTGAEESSETYNVFAVCDADDTTFTVSFSKSSEPTGATYFKKIGSFHNNSSSDIDRRKIYTNAYGYAVNDSSGIPKITAIYDYGTSASSFTEKNSDLKFAFGQLSVGADSTSTVSNLPFTSTSSFKCQATFDQNVTNDDGFAGCVPASASTLTIINQQGAGARTIQWMAIGY